MKKLFEVKKLLALFLCISLMLPSLSSAFASAYDGKNSKSQNESGYVDITETTELSETEAVQYTKYEAKVTSPALRSNASVDLTSTDILKFCTESSNYKTGDFNIVTYTADDDSFLPDCKTLIDISSLNNFLYIYYIASDGYEVMLCYTEDGLFDKCIYDEEADSAVYISNEVKLQYINFRYGCYYKISDEKLDAINACIESGNFDALSNINGIIVSEHENGTIEISEAMPSTFSSATSSATNFSATTSSATTEGFLNETQLFNSLANTFPSYTGKQLYSGTKDCSALGQKLSVLVKENRFGYVKLRANFLPFGVGTALTAIATRIGIKAPALATILSILGVVISAIDTIQEDISLCSMAEYEYTGTRRGYVYDPTRYNAYVTVKTYSSKGKFTGGYTNTDKWEWVRSIPSSFTKAPGDIANESMSSYNWDVALNGYCSQFYPN